MKKNAFTLIELSIVLVIIGLIIGGSFKVLKSMRENAKVTNAKNDVQTAKNAVLGYAMMANFLPTKTFFESDLSPVKANQHQLFYKHDTAIETKNICAFTTTALNVQVDHKDGTTQAIQDVAFVLASESVNKNLQTKLTNNGDGTFTVEVRKPYEKIDDEPTPINRAEEYDDIVEWVTLAELQKSVGCENKPLRIVNSSLPSTDTTSSSGYSAIIVVDGNYTTPTATSCTFSSSSTFPTKFKYNTVGKPYEIWNTGTEPTGTVTVTCSVTADGKPSISKKFAITVNP